MSRTKLSYLVILESKNMSWGKIYETTSWGLLVSYIHIGFNRASALAAAAVTILIDSVNILIDTITNRIN